MCMSSLYHIYVLCTMIVGINDIKNLSLSTFLGKSYIGNTG